MKIITETKSAIGKTIMKIINVIFAIILTLSGVAGFLKLKVSGIISEPSFDLFMVLSVFVGLFIAYSDKVISFSFRDWKMEFAKVKNARQEIEQIEQSIRKMALILSQIAVFIGAFGRRTTNVSNNEVEIAWLSKKANFLLSEIDATSDEKTSFLSSLNRLKSLMPF